MATANTEVPVEKEGGLPQLDFSTFEEQLVWLFLSFIVLFVIVSKVALPRITRVLEEREDRIAGDLDMAERLKKEAEEIKADYEVKTAEARAKAQAVIAEAKASVQAEFAATQAKLDTKLNAEADLAEQRIMAAKDEALAGLSAVAEEVTTELASKLAGLDADAGDVAKAVKTALDTVKGA